MHLRYMAAHIRIASRKDDPLEWAPADLADSFATLGKPARAYPEWLAILGGGYDEEAQPQGDPVERIKNSELVQSGIVTIEEFDADGRRIE